ncbi:MAG TPA: protein tyrosine phosphatase [Actinobacteria bacterium]|jgi:protein-tyrosine phosphatase|nr:protein tyrosine phosphatase [Actinomycetota bacterium]
MRPRQDRYQIAVVCLGNICRSPIAEKVLEQRLAVAGLDRLVTVESAGTAGWHVGKAADPRSQGALRRAGYSYGHTAQQFDPAWFERTDLVLGMDYDNVRDLRGMAPDSLEAGKVRIFRSFDPSLMHLPEDDPALATPDPYYGTDADFDAVVAMVEPAADGIIDHVRLELSNSRWGVASD